MIAREKTKRLIKISIFSIIILFIIGYTVFAFSDYISGPKITVIEPVSGSSVGTSTVILRGVALRIKDITLNGRPIFIDEQGNFKETLFLSKGYNISLLQASDKFGRTIEQKIELVY